MYKFNKHNCAKRIISHINLNVGQSSFGSFDRNYWGWLEKDFQNSTLIFSVCVLKKIGLISNSKIKFFELATLKNLKKIYKQRGLFDQSYPNEMHPTVGLDFCDFLVTQLNYPHIKKI